jgi:general secretion pathway protein D
MRKLLIASTLALLITPLFPLSIEEKRAAALQGEGKGDFETDQSAQAFNEKLSLLRNELLECYSKASSLEPDQPEEEYRGILKRINEIKSSIAALESSWREGVVSELKRDEEGYALWDQEETTLAQLVMEYGAMDYLYIIPPEMAAMKLNMHSRIPIPREAWGEVLEIILMHNGVGVKKLNAYAKQLYILKQDFASVRAFGASRRDLDILPFGTRLFYVFSPPPEQAKGVFQFFERFADTKQTFIYQVGGKVAIVSSKEEIEKLLSLYNLVWEEHTGKVARVVPVSKISAKEMEKVLTTFFGDTADRNRPPFAKSDPEALTVFSLTQGNAVALVGQQSVVARAEKIVQETEEQLSDPCENAIFIYSCRHSDPTMLAETLEKVYASLLTVPQEEQRENIEINYQQQGFKKGGPDGFDNSTPPLVVSPQPLHTGSTAKLDVEQGIEHFIPDPKTGNLMMVVRRDTYPRIRELLRRLDVPKKMVQIEVLLFERKLSNQNNFGLNLLKLGNDKNGVKYQGLFAPSGKGVFEFFFSGNKSKNFPAFDIAYSFLMTQEDVHLNAAPSIITVNQTPATIAIQEEISINNGAAPIDTNKGIAFEKAYSRANYGISIVFTPTVHLPDQVDCEEEANAYITLQTDITFDTTKPNVDDRPIVERRHIENEVRVLDGQTIILGGLRRKASRTEEEKVPFLGEIPGIGKLFGSTKLTSDNTEMFFFITPKVVLDSREELERIRTEELKKRPGDIPEFLERLVEARKKEKKKFFENSLKLFFSGNY